ncbi:MAG: hypothetical protein K2X81_19920 [Candidatus Obscuribacterales bacterium]|nr:hypothetical protein [Candidatus Obscuribacterales bacterium]
MQKRTYQSFLRKQDKLKELAHKLLVLWAELSSVSIHSVERITCDEEKITVRFRPEEYMPDGVYKLHCARNLSFPTSLLGDRYWRRTLKRIYGELKPVQQPFEIGYSLVGQ